MPTLWSSYTSSDSVVNIPPVLSYCLKNPMMQALLSYCADEEEVEVWILKELTPSIEGGEKGSVLTLLVLLPPELLTWLWVLVNLMDDPRSFELKSDLTDHPVSWWSQALALVSDRPEFKLFSANHQPCDRGRWPGVPGLQFPHLGTDQYRGKHMRNTHTMAVYPLAPLKGTQY